MKGQASRNVSQPLPPGVCTPQHIPKSFKRKETKEIAENGETWCEKNKHRRKRWRSRSSTCTHTRTLPPAWGAAGFPPYRTRGFLPHEHPRSCSFFFKILFIHERQRERERERQREREGEGQRHRQREKQAPCGEPDTGLDPGTPGSCPGPKAGAKPLGPPAVPSLINPELGAKWFSTSSLCRPGDPPVPPRPPASLRASQHSLHRRLFSTMSHPFQSPWRWNLLHQLAGPCWSVRCRRTPHTRS